jgi:hypothetical protein
MILFECYFAVRLPHRINKTPLPMQGWKVTSEEIHIGIAVRYISL